MIASIIRIFFIIFNIKKKLSIKSHFKINCKLKKDEEKDKSVILFS